MKRPSGAKGGELAEVVPAFVEMTDRILYGEVWERAGLSKRDRSMLTVAALMTANRHQQLEAHLGLALDNGVTVEELGEALLHLAFYASWPASVTASRMLLEVVEKRKG
ncbi:carboxymuconolactone decarboxylase family protein [Hephaestia sp. GCM10023244]|uniref:carboxymuconolactone decarboxylase family protein n=1 Tax=unclassified Hephaestia TaxID=2631281 RepID=UPI002076F0A6|nr:carboxymuconolactone decarboxylase family protein [Hephaestia sp. MAHUQ-44]MCM8732298.1 carboxymuconolactone decarboxylase family protein [Hephaestia sp. MAHUQ-44]